MPHASWTALNDDQQLALTREALRRAAETLADHAEILAAEMDQGTLVDRGGPDALRLFAAVVRTTNRDTFGPAGRA
jgi:Mor family transcriptional regulator